MRWLWAHSVPLPESSLLRAFLWKRIQFSSVANKNPRRCSFSFASFYCFWQSLPVSWGQDFLFTNNLLSVSGAKRFPKLQTLSFLLPQVRLSVWIIAQSGEKWKPFWETLKEGNAVVSSLLSDCQKSILSRMDRVTWVSWRFCTCGDCWRQGQVPGSGREFLRGLKRTHSVHGPISTFC